ncbi:MAG: hypothetical protein N3B14_03895 [Thermoleophilia bacterium]|nr:hypothetical protein [Thermoleophilia bacterium]
MIAQVILTPTESKKLIGQAVAAMPEVKKAALEGIVVLHPSSSTWFVVEALTGSIPTTNVWVCGAITPKGACGDMGVYFGEGSLNRVSGPGGFPHSWVIREGKLSVGETLGDLMEKMGSEDVYIKGVNAIDPWGGVGVMVGNPVEGGTIGFVLSARRKKPFHLIFPVGLEKLIPLPVEQAAKEAKRAKCGYAMGAAVGLLPCHEGRAVTEIDAIRILTGAEAVPIAAGGLSGAEGAVCLVIKGEDEQVRHAIDLVEECKGARIPQVRQFNCKECPNKMCAFPVEGKKWVVM